MGSLVGAGRFPLPGTVTGGTATPGTLVGIAFVIPPKADVGSGRDEVP